MFYLHKKLGISRQEIFGGRRFVQRKVDAPRRSGVFGRLKDLVYGRRQRVETFEEFTPGMSAETFASYIELFKDEAERVQKQREKRSAKNKLMGRGV